MEIERKYLVDKNILRQEVNLNKCEILIIEQAYISTEDNEVRIRKVEYPSGDIKTFMTIKSLGNLERQEVEFEIPKDKYMDIIQSKLYKGNIINKYRYRISLNDNLIAELDLYINNLLGLVTVEVEFSSIEEANSFIKPYWFSEEVTNNKKYKNKNLSLYDGSNLL